MTKQSRGVWLRSFKNVGLPTSPGDISEPQLASLVFETNCQVRKPIECFSVDSDMCSGLSRQQFPQVGLAFARSILSSVL